MLNLGLFSSLQKTLKLLVGTFSEYCVPQNLLTPLMSSLCWCVSLLVSPWAVNTLDPVIPAEHYLHIPCCRLRKKDDDSRGRARRRGSEAESGDRDKGGGWFKFRDKSDSQTSETAAGEQSRWGVNLEHVIIILYNDDRIQLTFGLNIATIKNDCVIEKYII